MFVAQCTLHTRSIVLYKQEIGLTRGLLAAYFVPFLVIPRSKFLSRRKIMERRSQFR